MKEYIDRIEVMKDIIDGEIEITGEGADFARQAVEGYRAVILKRLMAQPTEDAIPVEWIKQQPDIYRCLLILWEQEKNSHV